MTHFGIISPPVSGHINPLAALGRELLARGHRVTYLQMVDLEDKIRSEGVGFEPIGHEDHPRGSLPVSLAELSRLKGPAALRFTIREVARGSTMVCRDAPEAIRRAGIDALLVDQMEPAGGAVAEHLGIPFITVCNALAINRDPIVPPPFTPWQYRSTPWARARNALGYAVSDWLTAPITRVVAEYRKRWKLPVLRSPDDSFSKLAQICQMPKAFDYPRMALPPSFHYVGPLRGRTKEVPFPWDRLDGRPIVYASLGTLQNSRASLFQCFAQACDELDVQLVISHGGGLTEAEAASLPGNPLVVAYAPQEQLLERARLTITHAGLNTVLDSLAGAVPLVAIPLTYEQPAIAGRVKRVGAGCILSVHGITARRLRSSVVYVLERGEFRDSARQMKDAILKAGGVRRAGSLIESLVAI